MDTADGGDENTVISVYLTGKRGMTDGVSYIWNPSAALTIRERYRLLGDFTGCLPKHAAQNQYLTLPLVLSYEETCLGVQRGFLKVLSDSPTEDYRTPTEEDRKDFFEARTMDRKAQLEEARKRKEEAKAKALAKMGDLAGKKRKRQRDSASVPEKKVRKVGNRGFLRRLVDAFGNLKEWLLLVTPAWDWSYQNGGKTGRLFGSLDRILGRPRHNTGVDEVMSSRKSGEIENEHATKKSALREGATVTLTPCEARKFERVTIPRYAEAIPPPSGISAQRLEDRSAVFTDLYDRGFYLSCGAKFGADFLAYAAEPLLFHAVLAVIVVRKDENVSPLDLVAFGRLGDSTKKRTVLAYVDRDSVGTHRVKYVGVQWEETLP